MVVVAENLLSDKENVNVLDFKTYTRKKENKKDVSKKGISSEVYPLKKEDVKAIMDVLELKILEAPDAEKKQIATRNKLLFVLGTNMGLRASDMRLLKWSFFFDKNEENELIFINQNSLQPLKTKKTGKFVKLFFNGTVRNALYEYMEQYPVKNIDSYVFMGRKGQPITVQHIWRLIKNLADEAGIKQNVGSHTLRKTFGYNAYSNAEDKRDMLNLLQVIFNHSSSSVTARYIGVTDDRIKNVFDNLNLGMEDTEDI